LIDVGARIDVQNAKHDTPLHKATQYNSLDVLKVILVSSNLIVNHC